uniref:DUF1080 domain-containing protein n=1 Tax=Anaerolinea thermolimosa TaxID=229919 RepID=A0A7C4KKJ9_9CHLR
MIYMIAKKILPLILAVLLLAACNLPTRPIDTPTPTVDLVATQIANLLATQESVTRNAPLATQLPSPTPSATPEATPTPPPAPTPTTNPSDPALSLGDPTWKDSLDTAKNFYLFENDQTKVEAEDGALALTGRNANGWLGWSLTYAQNPSDFYLEATFRARTCAGSDLYGIVFRASKENAGYFFGVTCDGRYNLTYRDLNNDIQNELISMKAASAIQAGSDQINRLGVFAQGEKISLYINGSLIDEVTDSTRSSGYFGAFVAANQTAGFRADLDQIKLWKR